MTGPSFKTLFPILRQSSEVDGQYATSSCRFLPASRSCALNTSLSHLRMSDSSGSGISYHHGDDSDDEGHASDMPDTPNSKKRARPKQIQGKAWIHHGIITVDAALLHTASENDDNGPFSSLKALLLALWTSIYLQLEPKIKSSSCISHSSATSQASWHVRVMKMIRLKSKSKFGRSSGAITRL